MLNSLKIQNFRGFRCLEINDLGAVNIIGGRNNAGKTSLLEAIALLSSGGNAAKALNPQVLRLPSYVSKDILYYTPRPYPTVSRNPRNVAQALEAFFEPLFHDHNLQNAIEIGSVFARSEKSQKRATLKLSIDRQPVETLFVDTDEAISESIFYNRSIKLEFDSSRNYVPYTNYLWLEDNRIITRPRDSAKQLFASTLLKSGDSGDGPEYAQQLAELRRRKEDQVVLDALKIIEPRLESVSDISLTGNSLIVGDIGLDKLIPLAAMGDGMNQIARIILKMVSAQDGVALIDEVENGFHYSIQENVWRAIDETARRSNIQVFAATHSRECVLSAHEAIKPERLRYHRLEQIDSEIRCRTYSPDILESAFEFNFEVR